MEFPLKLYYLSGKNKNHLEPGVGYTAAWSAYSEDPLNVYLLNLGYRYENFSKRGVIAKLGFAPCFMDNDFDSYDTFGFIFSLGIGYAF